MGKHKFFYIITIWFLISQIFPPYHLIIRMGGALTIALFVGISLVLFPQLLSRKTIIALLILGIMNTVYFLIGNAFFEEFGDVIVPFLCMMSSLIIFEYATSYDTDGRYTKMVIVTSLLLNVVMALMTIPQLQLNPNLLRSEGLLLGDASQESTIHAFHTSYQTIHGLPFLIAPLFFLCKKSFRINKFVFISSLVTIITFIVLLLMANAATSMLMTVFMAVLGILFSFEQFTTKNTIKVILVGLMGLILTTRAIMVPILDFVSEKMVSTGASYTRVIELRDAMIYGELDGDLAARQDLYNNSQKLFWESPIIGTSSPELISKHTWIWDRLALYGLIFVWPVVLLFYFQIKKSYRLFIHTKVVYIFGVVAYLLMLYLKNEFLMGTWLYAFALLPLLCRCTDMFLENKYSK